MTAIDTLSYPYVRVLALWRWGTPPREIAERLGVDADKRTAQIRIAVMAHRLRKRGFDLVERKRGPQPDPRKGFRPCLLCKRQFWSQGYHNRVCAKCKESPDWLGVPRRRCSQCGRRFSSYHPVCDKCEPAVPRMVDPRHW